MSKRTRRDVELERVLCLSHVMWTVVLPRAGDVSSQTLANLAEALFPLVNLVTKKLCGPPHPLFKAAVWGSLRIVRHVAAREQYSSVGEANDDRIHALQCSCKNGHLEVATVRVAAIGAGRSCGTLTRPAKLFGLATDGGGAELTLAQRGCDLVARVALSAGPMTAAISDVMCVAQTPYHSTAVVITAEYAAGSLSLCVARASNGTDAYATCRAWETPAGSALAWHGLEFGLCDDPARQARWCGVLVRACLASGEGESCARPAEEDEALALALSAGPDPGSARGHPEDDPVSATLRAPRSPARAPTWPDPPALAPLSDDDARKRSVMFVTATCIVLACLGAVILTAFLVSR